jgi:hypothetical protein
MRITFPRVFRRTPVVNALPVTEQPSKPVTAPSAYTALDIGASNPGAHRIIDGDAGSYGRQSQGIVNDLNDGPVPNRIDRQTRAKNTGDIGPRMAAGYPYDYNRVYMRHQRIPRNPQTVTPYRKTIDTSVTVPSVGVGAPLP